MQTFVDEILDVAVKNVFEINCYLDKRSIHDCRGLYDLHASDANQMRKLNECQDIEKDENEEIIIRIVEFN